MAGGIAQMLALFATMATLSQSDLDVAVIPKPISLERREGAFEFTPTTRVFVDVSQSGADLAAEALVDLLRPSTGFALELVEYGAEQAESPREVSFGFQDGLPAEGYRLSVTPDEIQVRATDAAGLFYGFQTLRQLLPPQVESREPVDGPWTVPAVEIEDAPRFGWRGLHLDVGRHFMPIDFLYRYVDLLALHKMNRFHLHLTEDQGWRFESKKYPRLNTISAWRKETVGRPTADARGDGTPHGGFYSQDQLRDLVAYAAERHVTIVPEIEMPGHTVAVLAAYPELACNPGPFEVATRWGVFPDIFCAGKDEVFVFLENVLDEVMDVFPSTFIHIGGDEAPKERWEACPLCAIRMEEEGLADTHELQSYFIKRIDAFLDSRGRRLIGWDEILEGGLAEGAAVMSWRGESGGIQAASTGHDVVMSPNADAYYDHYQSQMAGEPEAIGGFTPLDEAYAYEPIPAELDAAFHHHVMGAQGNLWTEYMPTPEHVEYMAFPRGAAMAELTWTPKEAKDFDDFRARLDRLYARYDALGVNAWRPRELTLKAAAHIETSMDAMDNHPELCAFDDDPMSRWRSEGYVKEGDHFTVWLDRPTRANVVEAATGPGREILQHGVLEVSFDGSTWETVATFLAGEAMAELDGRPVQGVRLRATVDRDERLMVREVTLR